MNAGVKSLAEHKITSLLALLALLALLVRISDTKEFVARLSWTLLRVLTTLT
jgi:hypothetical protein